MKHLLSFGLTLFLLPVVASAQLTSENFQVEGASLGPGAVTVSGTSTNYKNEYEIGGLYTIDDTTPNSSSGGSSAKSKKKNAEPIIIGPKSRTVDQTVEVVIRTDDVSSSGDLVVQVSGANNTTAQVRKIGNSGLYSATYQAIQSGIDVITATINGIRIASDTDGVNDGRLHIAIIEKKVPAATPPESVPPEPGRGRPTELEFDFGVTETCHRAFSWKKGYPVDIYRTSGDTDEVLLATTRGAISWFIDTEENLTPDITYRLVARNGRTGTVTFTAEDLSSCTPDENSVIEEDIDGDSNEEQYIDGVYQDTDGSTVPVAVTDDGVILDSDDDGEADLFWNPGVGTSTVISAEDRVFIVDSNVSPTQTYAPITETSGYEVVLRKLADSLVSLKAEASELGRFVDNGGGEPTTSEEAESVKLATVARTTTSALGLLTGVLLTLLQSMGSTFSVSNIWPAVTRGWRFLFASLVFWRKRRPWGTVYDSATKAPVDPAYVELADASGNSVASAITDLDGRYSFLVKEGEYRMTVKKVNYSFPSTHRPLSGQDVLYTNLYYGGLTKVTDTITHDIPVDPLKFDWNQYEKMRTRQTKFIHRFDPYLARASNLFFYAGAIVTVWQFMNQPDLYTGGLAALYILLLLFRYLRGKPPLYGNIKKSGRPLPFALVRVVRDGVPILSKVADEYGRYVALVPPGQYTLCVDERVGDDSGGKALYQSVYTHNVTAKKGYISTNVTI